LRILLDPDNFLIFVLLSTIGTLLVRVDSKYAFVLDRRSMSKNREQHVFMKKSVFILCVSSTCFEVESQLLFRNHIQNP
jgi:hypothetical protein